LPSYGSIDYSESLKDLHDKVRIAYLTAKENPKVYSDEWEKAIKFIQEKWNNTDPIANALKDKLSESLLFSDEVKDSTGAKAKRVYEIIQNLKLTKPTLLKIESTVEITDITFMEEESYGNDPAWKPNLPKNMVLTYEELGIDGNEDENELDEILSTYLSDKTDLLIYGFNYTIDGLDRKFIDKYKMLKEDKELNDFIIPNKPMYRIFEIDDMKELKGFTGEWVVQEKYDGMRIQIHKNKEIKIYSFNNNDITSKFDKQIKIMGDKDFPDCILDAEAVLYENDEPLHRADTISYVNSKKDDNAFEIKIHVFDIIRLKGEEVYKNKLEERLRLLMGEFTKLSDTYLQFPSKSNTRFADSLEDIEEYAKEIMKNPTSEGVMIKDAKSSYIVGKKKNPKWIKWKKFVDLDLIILDVRKNKNGTFSYTLGAGPMGDEEYKPVVEYNNRKYLSVGKALNTKITSEVGKIIRVKVDEVKKTNKGFSIYSAKVIEKPEVSEPEKIITLEFLSKDNKKSASDYNIEALTKSYAVTDNVHGIVELNTGIDTDGFVLSGFYQDNLMAKNAIIDIDLWKQELAEIYKKDSGKLMTTVSEIVERGKITKDKLIENLKNKIPNILKRVFSSSNIEKGIIGYIKERGDAYGILYDKDSASFYHDGKTMVKEPETLTKMQDDTYEIWKREDGDINFIYKYKDKVLSWRIEQDNNKDIYELFGKASKYLAEVENKVDKVKKLDEGKIKIGSQRDGYHEYILEGNMYKGKFHVRVVPIMNEDKWVAWTGYETKPTDKDSDEGLWNIQEDKYKNITYSNK
tara:strand:- start:2242 stop:4647 length:2406 start_codon:yes stop_codon:yes gene_type:complete